MLGFPRSTTEFPGAAFLRGSGSDNHHDLGLFSVGRRGAPGPSPAGSGSTTWPGRSPTIDDLAELAERFAEAGALVGASDHGVSKSLYAKDLDGNEFEIMWAVPR